MKQGDDTWMKFISDMEEAVDLCRLNIKPYSREDAIKVAALACMCDRSLAGKIFSSRN